jgi:REP element-mobilizing transposase RayT
MTSGYKIKDQEGLYFLTFQIVDWIDVFTRKIYRDIIIDSFKFMIDEREFQLFSYVIMSNHIHLIANSSNGKLSDAIRDFKKYTSKRIIDTIMSTPESRMEWMLNRFESKAKEHTRNEVYQVWTHQNHPEILYSEKFIVQKINYIHNNPVRAGIVDKPEDYIYSSARNYASLEAPIEIQILMLKWHTY